MLGDLNEQITDVHIESKDTLVVLYDNRRFRGMGLVIHYQGPRTLGLPGPFNDWASSARTQKLKPRKLRDLLGATRFEKDDGVYDVRWTQQAEDVAGRIKDAACASECKWEYLEIDLRKATIKGEAKIVHRNRLGQHTTDLKFEGDAKTGKGLDVKVRVGLRWARVEIDLKDIFTWLKAAAVI